MADEDPDADEEPEVVELDELEQAASTGPATTARPPAVSKRRRLSPTMAEAGVLLVAIEMDMPLSHIKTARRSARIEQTLRLRNFRRVIRGCR
jgi:hypothetical protein